MRTMGIRQQARASLGVVYLCVGEIYREYTALSVWHLRRFGYSGPVRIVTDGDRFNLPGQDCEVIRVQRVGDGFASRHFKTQINRFGWDTTLFLDADAIPIAPISHIWRELRLVDLCMSMDLHPDVQDLVQKSERDRGRRQAEYRYMEELGLMRHSFFSSGVMLFRRTAAVERLFTLWHEEWNHFQDEDQLALVRAISRTKCRIHTLAPRWNARLSGFRTVREAQLAGVRILHLRPAREDVPAELLRASA